MIWRRNLEGSFLHHMHFLKKSSIIIKRRCRSEMIVGLLALSMPRDDWGCVLIKSLCVCCLIKQLSVAPQPPQPPSSNRPNKKMGKRFYRFLQPPLHFLLSPFLIHYFSPTRKNVTASSCFLLLFLWVSHLIIHSSDIASCGLGREKREVPFKSSMMHSLVRGLFLSFFCPLHSLLTKCRKVLAATSTRPTQTHTFLPNTHKYIHTHRQQSSGQATR